MAITDHLLNHRYPSILLRFPWLIRFAFWFQYIAQLRKWTIMPHWNTLLKSQKEDFIVADFGAGEGQFLIPFCKVYPKGKFIAADIRRSNVEFCNAFRYQNLNAVELNIERSKLTPTADVGICASVLHYMTDDIQTLINMRDSLKPGAKLLLYVPVNGFIITPVYRAILKHFEHYDTVNPKKQQYTPMVLKERVVHCGFQIVSAISTYGWFGILGHEIFSSFSILLASLPWIIKPIVVSLLIVFIPLIVLLYAIDVCIPKTNGNGLLLILQKPLTE